MRLGRGPAPVLSYADLIVNNWRSVDTSAGSGSSVLRLRNLRLLVPTVDNQEEHVFYLTQLEILARCAPIVVNVARAQDAVRAGLWDDAAEALHIIETVLIEVNTHALRLIDPRARSATFVDPVIWAKTVAPFAVPLTPGVLGPSGTASPVINLLDAFFDRNEHASQLGHEILAHRHSYPVNWQRFIALVGQTSVHAHLTRGPRELLDRFAAAREAYAGSEGFLGRHRRKVYGYLTVAFTVGRDVTIGGFSGSPPQRRWNDVDAALTASLTEREPAGGQEPVRPSTKSAVAPAWLVPEDTDGPPVSLADLLDHNDAQHGWWVAVDGRVYDVTTFVRRHPGGTHILQAHSGLDATEAFRRAHRDPERFSHLRHSLELGCLERPTQGQSLPLQAAYALVELQNTLRLDRSFGNRTRLCDPSGTDPSALQINRATDTLDRFHNQYLPDFVREVLTFGSHIAPTTRRLDGLPPDCHTEGREPSPEVLRGRLDDLEQWMATVKSGLLKELLSRSARKCGMGR
jgi:predicted heme/steroid binding protein